MIRHGRLSRTRWWVSRSRARCHSAPVSHTPSEDRQITPSLTELAGHLMRRLGHGVGLDDRHPERLLELAEDLGLLRPGR